MNELRRIALRFLARREHSRLELARKLAPHGNQEEIDILLAELQKSGLMSDARCAESWLRGHVARFGAARLRRALHDKGIDEETVERQMAEVGDELERARAIWSRKFGSPPADRREWARQARFMQSRGFSGDVVRRLLREPEAS